MFLKYQHVEKWGNEEVENIEVGKCYVFPKIDGTNSSIWMTYNNIYAGSRNRELSLESDNAGFLAWVIKQPNIIKFLFDNPDLRLFGEWLVPHSLKTYRETAWNKFYVFDVMNGEKYLTYDEYVPLLGKYSIDFIPCQKIITNGSYEHFIHELSNNVFLIEDGKGVGEGIVIKNYDYVNRFGRTTWAKIVTSEFKEKHIKEMGAPEVTTAFIEEKIIDEVLTKAMIEKEYDKIKVSKDGWRSEYIPELLGKVFYTFVNEEIWNVLKKYKNPKIDFKKLNNFVVLKTKKELSQVF